MNTSGGRKLSGTASYLRASRDFVHSHNQSSSRQRDRHEKKRTRTEARVSNLSQPALGSMNEKHFRVMSA